MSRSPLADPTDEALTRAAAFHKELRSLSWLMIAASALAIVAAVAFR